MKPYFDEKNIAILSGCNDDYIPYLSVLLSSIIRHISYEFNYDIVLFEFNVSEKNKKLIVNMCSEISNVSIRFCKIPDELSSNSEDWKVGKWTKELYISLLSPYILVEYDKIIYMDCDVINCKDLAELYSIQMGDYLVAASRLLARCCIQNGGFLTTNSIRFEEDKEIDQLTGYFNNGVMMLNLRAFRENYSLKEVIDLIATQNFPLLDQDCINYLCRNKTLYIDWGWNSYPYAPVEFEHLMELCPVELKEYFRNGYKLCKNIHYTIPVKPWLQPLGTYIDSGLEFWKYATSTPFYEELLEGMHEYLNKQIILRNYEKNSWEEFRRQQKKEKRKKVVLYGYGKMGKQLVNNDKINCQFDFIVDNDKSKMTNEDRQIVDLKEFSSKSDDKQNYMILISNYNYQDIVIELDNLGYKNLYIYVCMQSINYAVREKDYEKIVGCAGIFEDEKSCQIYNAIVNKRTTFAMNKNVKCSDIYEGNMYFYNSLFNIGANEKYLDIGYNSEYTSKRFIQFVNESYQSCRAISENDHFELVEDDLVSFIKINVGNTLELLKRLKDLIEHQTPKMAINISNKGSDLWKIPMYLKETIPKYKLYIRHHSTNFSETVLYVVPYMDS